MAVTLPVAVLTLAFACLTVPASAARAQRDRVKPSGTPSPRPPLRERDNASALEASCDLEISCR